jgi:hypothetical protein
MFVRVEHFAHFSKTLFQCVIIYVFADSQQRKRIHLLCVANIFQPLSNEFFHSLITAEGFVRSSVKNIYFMTKAMETYVYESGATYVGEMQDGLFFGRGKLTFSNGDVYEGCFENDKMNGVGVYHYNNGDVYDGEFVDDQFHGIGKYVHSCGTMYAGKFRNDQRIGKFLIKDCGGDIKFSEIVFQNDKPITEHKDVSLQDIQSGKFQKIGIMD